MNFEKMDSSLEKTSVGNVETNSSQLEKNIEVAKPDSVLAKESSENFMNNLEKNVEVEKADTVHENESAENFKEDSANEITPDKLGGSYKDVRNQVVKNEVTDVEVHHMPAKSVSYLDVNDGPAIAMEKADHRKTASCGKTLEAAEYRNAQKEKIDKGDFMGAFQMDVDDIHSKFGNKYDKEIESAQKYIYDLKKEGKIE